MTLSHFPSSSSSSFVIRPSWFLSDFSEKLSQLGHGESALPGDQPPKNSHPSPTMGVVQAQLGAPRERHCSRPVLRSYPLSAPQPAITTSTRPALVQMVGVPYPAIIS